MTPGDRRDINRGLYVLWQLGKELNLDPTVLIKADGRVVILFETSAGYTGRRIRRILADLLEGSSLPAPGDALDAADLHRAYAETKDR